MRCETCEHAVNDSAVILCKAAALLRKANHGHVVLDWRSHREELVSGKHGVIVPVDCEMLREK